MIKNYKYISPFKILISFHKLIEGLEQIALSDVDYRSNYAKGLLSQIKDKTEFRDGINNLDVIKNNQELIRYLLADLFPTALTNNEIKEIKLVKYILDDNNKSVEIGFILNVNKCKHIEKRVNEFPSSKENNYISIFNLLRRISDDDFNTAQLIALSHNIPSVKVSDTKSAQEFLNDDGGY
jgi:hypothetical protein